MSAPAEPVCAKICWGPSPQPGCGGQSRGVTYLFCALEADPAAGGGDARLAAAVRVHPRRLAGAALRCCVLAAARIPAARALLPGLRTSLGTVLAGVAAAGGWTRLCRLCAHGEMTSGD